MVNKADREGAPATTRELRAMIALGARGDGDWTPAIVTTVATRGEGIDDLVEAIERHRQWARDSGDLRQRRRQRLSSEIEALALDRMKEHLGGAGALAERVLDGELDPYAAARLLTRSLQR